MKQDQWNWILGYAFTLLLSWGYCTLIIIMSEHPMAAAFVIAWIAHHQGFTWDRRYPR